MESNSFIKTNETVWQQLGEGVSRQILGYNQDLMMVKVKFEKGAVGSLHQHVHTQTTFVARGVFEFTVDGVTSRVEAGDGIYMKPNVLHGCKCLEEGLLIDTFSPLRTDFLKQ